MTSTISLSKVNTVIKNNFRRNIANLIVANGAIILSVLAICASVLGLPHKEYSPTTTIDVTSQFSYSAYMMLCVIGFIYMLALTIKIHKEIYSRRACDFFYSMPVTRKEYYIGNVLFGILNILIMTIVLVAVALVFGKLPIAFDVEHNFIDVKLFIGFMLNATIEIVLSFALFIMSAVLCGRKWQVIATVIMFDASISAIISAIAVRMNMTYGYVLRGTGDSADILMAMFNGGVSASDIAVASAKFVFAVITFAIGYFVFKYRKAEVAEGSFSGRVVPALLLLAVSGAAFLSAFTLYEKSLYEKIIAGLIFSFVITVIFCAVFYKKAVTKDGIIVFAVACAVSIAVMIGITQLPKATGYVKYMPSADEIQSVEFEESPDNYAYVNEYSFSSSLDYMLFGEEFYEFDKQLPIKFESEDGIERVLNLHQKALDDEIIAKYERYIDPNEDFYTEDGWFSFKLVYHLKNGKTVTRCYAMCCNDMTEAYANIVRSDEYIDQSFPFTLDKDSILFARVEAPYYYEDAEIYDESWEYTEDYGVTYSEESYFALDNYDEFFSLLRQDMKARSDINALLQITSYLYMYDEYVENEQYIYIYYLDEDTPADVAEKIRNMTPSQVEKYIFEKNEDFYVLNEPIILSTSNDENATQYLIDRGILY